MKKLSAIILAATFVLSACSNESAATPAPGASSPQVPAASVAAPSAPEQTPLLTPVPVPTPDVSWQTDTPENHGMNPAVFEQMHTALANAPVYASLTAKDGVIIDEYYQDGYDENSKFAMHSCSKSFTSALIGIAIEQGYIGGVDDMLSDYLPQVASLTDGKQNLTLRHLLTQTSGIEWYEWGGGTSNWNEFRGAANWVDYILGRRQAAQPGAVFNYSTGNTHLLAAALQAATGMSELEFGKLNLFDPLGMDSIEWGTDPQGVNDGGNGVVITPRDAARFGQLFLQGGEWNGVQLVPEDWARESTAAQNNGAGDGTGSYGFQWWTRTFNGYDTYYAFGAWGQYIFVVPELNLVSVIASEGPQSSYASRVYFTDYVLAAVEAQS